MTREVSSQIPNRIAVCQNPYGEGQYIPAEDTGDERCFIPGCGCTPLVYVREDRQRPQPGVMHSVDQAFYDLALKERDFERARVDRLMRETVELRNRLEGAA